MKTIYLRTGSDGVDVVTRRENASLRRENAELNDRLAAAERTIAEQRRTLDDYLDMAMGYSLSEETERLAFMPTAWRAMGKWAHADSGPLTVAQAHDVMQEHRLCITGECRIRRTAVRVLRENGRMGADSHRPHLIELPTD
ncbi:hypothetical protein [Nocardia nova]